MQKSLILLSLLISGILAAQTPLYFTYQGKLPAEAIPTGNTVDITFLIYDDTLSIDAANLKWSKLFAGVPVNDGIFSVLVGPLTENLFSSVGERWVEIKAGSTTFSPRSRLVSSPFAIHSRTANQLTTPNADGALAVTVDITSKVGVGTNNPSQQLTVNGFVAAQQVAFSAYVAEKSISHNQNPLPMTFVSINTGDHYDTSSSTFTAPVNGLYQFEMYGFSATTNGGLAWHLLVDGIQAYSSLAVPSGEEDQLSILSWESADLMLSRTFLLQLNAGAKITVQQEGNGYCDDFRSGLNGVLLYATP